MKRTLWTAVQFAGSIVLLCGTARFCDYFGANRVIAAMMLLLEVLAIATLGDWILALLSSTVASFAFSYYFIEETGSFRLTTLEGFVTFGTMALTAVTATARRFLRTNLTIRYCHASGRASSGSPLR